MSSTIAVNDGLNVGRSQPSKADLESLKEQGYRTVVNLRVGLEEEGQLLPEDEGEFARSLGLSYLHIPVPTRQFREEQVDEFRNAIQQLPQPVFVHCKSGKRSGAFALMHHAVEQGWSGDETLRNAEQLGFKCDQPELAEFVRTYVDARK